jgi:translation elongation factor EF-Tu-like GTPase
MSKFEHYVLGFYGKGGVYEFNAPQIVILNCCSMVERLPNFEGDSVDRETVRRLLEALGFEEKETPPVSSAVMLEAVHAHYDSILSPWKF